jgi:histone deacetylase 11
MIPIVYHSGYNITACGLERLHPFDSRKYRRIHDELVRQGLRRPGEFATPRHPSRQDISSIHDPQYLNSLWSGLTLAKILEVPIVLLLPVIFTRWRVLRPMRLAMGGTILACRLALSHGLSINLGGGFHHASGRHGHGFCVYADVPTALAVLHREGLLQSALVIDTDAHQGDGTADAVREWGWVSILDFFDSCIFPIPKVAEDLPVPLPPACDGATYLDLLHQHVPEALDRLRPGLVVYNAGSDVLADDRLSTLQLTPDEMEARDLAVVTAVRERGIPLAMVLSGGYGPRSWSAHARSIESILARFDVQIDWGRHEQP